MEEQQYLTKEEQLQLSEFCDLKKQYNELEKILKNEDLKIIIQNILKKATEHKVVFQDNLINLITKLTCNYKSANHPRYNTIIHEIEKLKEEKESIEAFIKNVPASGVSLILSDGTKAEVSAPTFTKTEIIYFKEK